MEATAAMIEAQEKEAKTPKLPKNLDTDVAATLRELYRLKRFPPTVQELAGPEGGGTEKAAPEPEAGAKPSAATEAVKMLGDVALWSDPQGRAFASIPDGEGGMEAVPLKSQKFTTWLEGAYYKRRGKALNSNARLEAVGILRSKAIFDGPTVEMHPRVAPTEGGIILDLGPGKHSIKITQDGADALTALTASTVSELYRPRGMKALPDPVTTAGPAEVKELHGFLNLSDEGDFRLFIAQVLSWMLTDIPIPGMSINGEQGSAKTTNAKVAKALIDPHVVQERTKPADGRDLAIAANNQRILFLDNLSKLDYWLSDALCGLSTGYGFATRELYSDSEETIFTLRRPFILTGIIEVAKAPDLLDRLIIYHAPRISPENRRREKQFWADFDEAHPRILGGLLNVLAKALKIWPTIEAPDDLPRMADFSLFGIAVEQAMDWPAGSFLEAYHENIERQNDVALANEPIATALKDHVREVFFDGPTALHNHLYAEVGEETRRAKHWPKSASALGARMRRIAPNLRAVGWTIELDLHDTEGNRRWRIEPPAYSAQREQTPSTASTRKEAQDQSTEENFEHDFPFTDQEDKK